MDATQKIVRLKTLVASAGENYYERISLAAELLADRHWLETEHRGNDIEAAQALEDEYFHDLCGVMGLWGLLQIYRRYPNQSDWKKFKYNLRKMYESLKPEPSGREPYRRATVAELDAARGQAKALEATLKHEQKKVVEAVSEVEALRQKVVKLQRENERLKGRIEELERIIDVFNPKKTA